VIGTILLAIGVAAGLSWRRVAILALLLFVPLLTAAVIAIVAWRNRPREDVSAVLFCEGVASELRAGATLRQALASAATSVGVRPSPLGAPIEEVASRLASSLAGVGEEMRLTIITAARSGGGAAGIFDELASFALAQSEIDHELRVAAAPGRATALVLVGAPLVFVVSRVTSGDIWSLLASAQQRIATLVGLGMFLLGITIATTIVWRASA
jgi:hypothetical protein